MDGLESEQIGAVGLDVIEDEFGMYYYDRKSDILSKRDCHTARVSQCDRDAAHGVLHRRSGWGYGTSFRKKLCAA